MPNECQICEKQIAKYKCVECFLPFCSVTCGNIHKGSEQCKNLRIEQACKRSTQKLDEAQRSLYMTENTVDPKTLSEIGYSEEIINLLKNPQLREILFEIDKHPRADVAIKNYMTNPLFSTFCDVLLKIN